MNFRGNCQTTAMGIMPHTDIGNALQLSLSLDIPFWPQLPRVSYIEILPKGCAASIAKFLKNGGIISWGIVPTDSFALEQESPEKLSELLHRYWATIAANSDITIKQVAEQALIAPARCCLMNSRRVGANNEQAVRNISGSCVLQSEERLVEMAFEYLKVISDILRKEFGLYNRS